MLQSHPSTPLVERQSSQHTQADGRTQGELPWERKRIEARQGLQQEKQRGIPRSPMIRTGRAAFINTGPSDKTRHDAPPQSKKPVCRRRRGHPRCQPQHDHTEVVDMQVPLVVGRHLLKVWGSVLSGQYVGQGIRRAGGSCGKRTISEALDLDDVVIRPMDSARSGREGSRAPRPRRTRRPS